MLNIDPYVCVAAVAPRTGSTLYQRMVNTKDGLFCWGENLGFVTQFLETRRRLMKVLSVSTPIAYLKNKKDDKFIANIITGQEHIEKAVEQSLKTLFYELYCEETHNYGYDKWGFKEWRCGENEVEYLLGIFPDIKVVGVTRNPLDMWRSVVSTFPFMKNSLRSVIVNWNDRSEYFINKQDEDDRVQLFKLEDTVEQMDRFCSFLGIEDKSKVLVVVDNKISGSKRGCIAEDINDVERDYIIETCGDVMLKLGYGLI